MDVLCELYPVEMTAIFASKCIFAAAATGGARTAELPTCNFPFPSERVFNSATFMPMLIPLKTLRNFSNLHLKNCSG